MKVWALFFGLMIFWPNQTLGQEASRHSIPLVVSHLSSENKALLRRKAAPKHNVISRVICFKKICRGFIGWRKKQRSMRFKGYKSGGKLPSQRTIKPTILKDSLPTIFRKSPIKVDTLKDSHEQVLILDEVLFEINSAHLNKAFTYRLDSLIQFLSTHQTYRVSISGHTDNTGNEDHNLSLSNARAGAVALYVEKNNIAGHRISFEGLGSTKPIASNETEEGRRKNRRVEIMVSEY